MTGMPSVEDLQVRRAHSDEIGLADKRKGIRSYDDVMECLGVARNTGNFLITEGASILLDGHAITYIPFWRLMDLADDGALQDLSKQFDFCIFVTANILNKDFHLDREARILSALDMPTIVMSVGIQRQSDLRGGGSESVKRFVEFLKRGATHTFTRGAVAADFLRSSGVANVHEASCPSTFAFPDETVKSVHELRQVSPEQIRQVWINGYLGAGPEYSVEDIAAFSRPGVEIDYIFQDEPLLLGSLNAQSDSQHIYDESNGLLMGPITLGLETIEDTRVRFRMFFSPSLWRHCVGDAQFLIGRRFHGNLVGMQVGKPALFIAHDERVVEMLSAIGLPFVDADQWASEPNKLRFIEGFRRSVDPTRFEETYRRKREQFVDRLLRLIG